MSEPARKPEPQDEPRGFQEVPRQPKIARSGYAIWSLIFGLIGTVVFMLPGLLETVIVLPSSLRPLVQLRGLLALSSLLALFFGLIALSQIQKGIRRGAFMAVIGGALGTIGILAWIFGI